jgi:hypothetical protein
MTVNDIVNEEMESLLDPNSQISYIPQGYEHGILDEDYQSVQELKRLADDILYEVARRSYPDTYNNGMFMNLQPVHLSDVDKTKYKNLRDFVENSNVYIFFKPKKKESAKYGDYRTFATEKGERFNPAIHRPVTIFYDHDELAGAVDSMIRDYNNDGKNIGVNGLHSKISSRLHNFLMHELQHAYDDYRSKGMVYNTKQFQDYWKQYAENEVNQTKMEDLEKFKKYSNLPHEVWARFSQTVAGLDFMNVDLDASEDYFIYRMTPVKDVVKRFTWRFPGYKLLPEKVKWTLIKRMSQFWHHEQSRMAEKNKEEKRDWEVRQAQKMTARPAAAPPVQQPAAVQEDKITEARRRQPLKKILASREAYEILDNSKAGECTWCAGGCAILAHALNMLYGYPVYVVYNLDLGQADHFLVTTPQGTFIDCDGEQTDLLRNFRRKEFFDRPGTRLKIMPYNDSLKNAGIPVDMEASRKLAMLIKNGLPEGDTGTVQAGTVQNGIDEIAGKDATKKLYYQGRTTARPYTGKYIFITDSIGYASGYSDGEKLYTYTIPFSEMKLFSIKNPGHLDLLKQFLDRQTIESILRDSGPGSEIDWAAFGYISTDDYEAGEDLLQYLGFYGVRLKEREGVESIYIFDQDKLKFEGTVDITTPEMIKAIGDYYKWFTKGKNFLEEGNPLELRPNVSRKSGLGTALVYLSIDETYANAYANGQTSAAHAYRFPVENGVVYHVCLSGEEEHFGGDVWKSGYKDEIVNDLKNHIKGGGLGETTQRFFDNAGIDIENMDAGRVLAMLMADDLSLIPPVEWSYMQEDDMGYSEIGVKEVPYSKIVKAEVYRNGNLVKTIRGGYKGGCETVFYHGSPYFEHLLKEANPSGAIFNTVLENDPVKGIPPAGGDPEKDKQARFERVAREAGTNPEYALLRNYIRKVDGIEGLLISRNAAHHRQKKAGTVKELNALEALVKLFDELIGIYKQPL